jgi:hypothetical protein
MEPGTYQCKTIEEWIEESQKGAVMFYAMTDIGLRGGICLIQKDGTMRESGFKDVQAIRGESGAWNWEAWNVAPADNAGHDVEAVVETVQGERGDYSSVKYINVPGGSAAQLTKPDAKALAAKYGAKTRALFGGAPSAPKPPAAPKAPPKPPAAPAAPQATSTMEACWQRFCELNSSRTELQLYADWPKELATSGVADQNAATPADWGRVLAKINGETLPY